VFAEVFMLDCSVSLSSEKPPKLLAVVKKKMSSPHQGPRKRSHVNEVGCDDWNSNYHYDIGKLDDVRNDLNRAIIQSET
jgi:hypothetical protein